jgi:hypothetical protein
MATEAFSASLEALGGPAVCCLVAAAAALLYCVFEQLQFRWTCKQLAAPAGWFVPVVGGIVDMVRDPYGFWERQRLLQPAGISKFFLLGKTVFFSTDTEVSRRILMHNGPESLMMVRRQGLARSGLPARHRRAGRPAAPPAARARASWRSAAGWARRVALVGRAWRCSGARARAPPFLTAAARVLLCRRCTPPASGSWAPRTWPSCTGPSTRRCGSPS